MTEAAVLDWINTFEAVDGCSSLTELCSGYIVGLMLSEIEPGYFGDLRSINDTSDNWALSASNIKKITRKIESYFRESQQKRVDITEIDANIIAKGQDVSHIICLLELVIGVAVLCDNKAQFIPKIFSLQQDSQVVLKSMVERVMARLYDIDDGTQHGQEDSQFLSSQLKDAQDLIQSQAVELEEIRLTFQEVVTVNTALKQEVEALKEKEFQREVDTDSDRSRAEAAAAVQSHMKVEMEDLRAQVSAMSSELETFRQDNFAMSQRLDENEQIRTRLEVEALQMADELDIARDKAIKLTKAEATIAKYQTKMEEMAALKNQNKEMEATMDKYLEQIHELETASRSANSTAKMVEKYKDKSVVLERERFEAISALEMKADELSRVKSDLDSALDAKRFLEEELASVSAQLEVAEAEAEKAADGDRHAGFGVFESPAALKEKIKQLELELRVARRESAAAGDGVAGQGGSGLASAAEESSVAIEMLQAELDDTRAAKREREDALLATKKELAEAQHDLRKALSAQEEAERTGGSAAAKNSADAESKVRELEQQLALKANTLKHLEGLLMESETKLNKAEHDKEKLEIFAKRSLTNFKEKYMAALQRYKNEKNALEVKLQAMAEKQEREQERFRREERLMLSAVYELGVQTMERSINLQIHETAAAPTTFLSAQRADQERRLNPAIGSGTPSTTSIR